MCLICVEMEKGRLKPAEAWHNLSEMRQDMEEDHIEYVEKQIILAEAESSQLSEEEILNSLLANT